MARTCTNCGAKLKNSDKFCQSCGAQAPQQLVFCSQCGTQVEPGVPRCPNCGATISPGDSLRNRFDNLTGSTGKVGIRFVDMFSGIFKRHTEEDRAKLFTAGTRLTTPAEKDMIAEWPRPWLYSRIFAFLALTFLILYATLLITNNINLLPGLMMTGALTFPFAFLIFFWEFNVPRNINIFTVVRMFFVGGVFSLVFTLINYAILGDTPTTGNFIGPIFIGIAEEIGKMIIVLIYVKKLNCKYILSGLLIGAAIGAGFAFFETFGYIFRYFVVEGFDSMMGTIILRAVLSLGGHVVWTAIAGAAFVGAKKDSPQIFVHLADPKFVVAFVGVIILHAVWDMPIEFGSSFYLIQWLLTLVALVIIFFVLMIGLHQIEKAVANAQQQEAYAQNPEYAAYYQQQAQAQQQAYQQQQYQQQYQQQQPYQQQQYQQQQPYQQQPYQQQQQVYQQQQPYQQQQQYYNNNNGQ